MSPCTVIDLSTPSLIECSCRLFFRQTIEVAAAGVVVDLKDVDLREETNTAANVWN
jgi:hypothetical protein